MSLTPRRASKVFKIVVLGVLGALGIALTYCTVQQSLARGTILVLTLVYVSVAAALVKRFTGMRATAPATEPAGDARTVPDIVKAIGCFLAAGILGWFGPRIFPDTVTGVMIFIIPGLLFVLAGGVFVAKSVSRRLP